MIEHENCEWHKLVKNLCDEWNEECEPKCDSYGHDEACAAVEMRNAMQKRRLRYEKAEKALSEFRQATTDLAKAFRKLENGGFINSYEPDNQAECDHYCFIAHQAIERIVALTKPSEPSHGAPEASTTAARRGDT